MGDKVVSQQSGSHASLHNRRAFLAAFTAAAIAPRLLCEPLPRLPTFVVLSLFKPRRVILYASARPLELQLDDSRQTLAIGSSLILDADDNRRLEILKVSDFAVEVPHKLRRDYIGKLTIDNVGGTLRCVVAMEREIAVASIVAAESPPHAAVDSLAAQAIAARSFLLGAKTAHANADFCDTTHCQYLREPPPAETAFSVAARHTSGLVLRYQNDDGTHTLAAMYSRSCGGRTRTLAELGLPARGYPYYAVDCAFCRAHPEAWQRDSPDQIANTERGRLDYNRIHGWSALPGHVDKSTALRIEGRGVGHGIGLCQLGAADMAVRGATFAEILTHYYPNTTLAQSN
jgi:stage II sporulation protein D